MEAGEDALTTRSIKYPLTEMAFRGLQNYTANNRTRLFQYICKIYINTHRKRLNHEAQPFRGTKEKRDTEQIRTPHKITDTQIKNYNMSY